VGEVLARIVSESPRSVRSLRPEIPEGLSAVITECLDRNLAGRVRTVAELAAKLAPFAPKQSAISVDRILRISGIPGEGRIDTDAIAPIRSVQTQSLDTGPQWVRSHSTPSPPGMSMRARLLIGAALGLVISAIMLLYTFGLDGLTRKRASASTLSSSPITPLTPPEAMPDAAPEEAVERAAHSFGAIDLPAIGAAPLGRDVEALPVEVPSEPIRPKVPHKARPASARPSGKATPISTMAPVAASDSVLVAPTFPTSEPTSAPKATGASPSPRPTSTAALPGSGL
jgi:eukaryotic-like serine/threonine-protein kinase